MFRLKIIPLYYDHCFIIVWNNVKATSIKSYYFTITKAYIEWKKFKKNDDEIGKTIGHKSDNPQSKQINSSTTKWRQ